MSKASYGHLKRPRKPAHGQPLSRLGQIRFESGKTKHQIAAAAKVPPSVINELEKGRLPHNEPRLPAIAAAYNVDVEVVREQCNQERTYSDKILRVIESGALIRKTKRPRGRPRKDEADTVPTGNRLTVAKGSTVAARGRNGQHTYDVQREIPKGIKKLLKAMADVVNVQVIKGAAYLDMKMVPTREMSEMLSDYFKTKGINVPIVLAENYGGVFDE